MMEERYFFITPEKARELIEHSKQIKTFKAGGNSRAFIVGNFVVLEANIHTKDLSLYKDKKPLDVIIQKLHKLKQQGVSVVPILGYCYNLEEERDYGDNTYNEGYIIQEKAQGQELWDYDKMLGYKGNLSDKSKKYIIERIRLLADAPQEHYDKFVLDYIAIEKENIMIDPSKTTNFFYDPKVGFSFIDLNHETKSKKEHELKDICFIRHCLIVCLSSLRQKELYTEEELKQIEECNLMIFKKCKSALIKVGYSERFIEEALSAKRIDRNFFSEYLILGYNFFQNSNEQGVY